MNSPQQHSSGPHSLEQPATDGDDDAEANPAPESGVAPAGSQAPADDADPHRDFGVRNTVFLSYSHDDQGEDWYTDVKQYLQQLSLGGDDLQLWDDTNIKPGDDWRASIEAQLRGAKAAVFLVTPTFLTSQFIAGEEVPKLLERQALEGLVVHALIAKPCDWEEHAIGEFLRSHQLSHSPDRTLEEMEGPERRRTLNELVKQIKNTVGLYRHRNRHDRRTEKIRELESLLGVAIDKEIAGGDSSIIYRARKGEQVIAVKAMVSRPITDVGQEELKAEFNKCRTLQSPVFTRMFDLAFSNGYCVTTTDWIPGPKLSRQLVACQHNRAERRRWQGKATAFLSKLASALAEADANGLRFLNIHPDKIRLYGDDAAPRLYPIDLSTYVASSAHANGVFSFPMHALEYLAPEYVSKPAEREDPLAAEQADEAKRRMRSLADQYALGMVALTILEGRAPVKVHALSDITRLMRFQQDPRGYAENGERLEDRQWRREMPGLARIIWRMLEPDPADRWQDMTAVSAQLRALLMAEFDTRAHGSEAKTTYSEHLMGNDGFYARFYAKLFAGSPEIEARFAQVDMRRQRAMLDAAIERVLNFRPNQREPTTLSQVANSHRHMGLTAEHFESFGLAFIEALAEEPSINRAALDAWEAIIWPAIEYLKQAVAPARKKAAKPKNASSRKKALKPKKAPGNKNVARKKARKPKQGPAAVVTSATRN